MPSWGGGNLKILMAAFSANQTISRAGGVFGEA